MPRPNLINEVAIALIALLVTAYVLLLVLLLVHTPVVAGLLLLIEVATLTPVVGVYAHLETRRQK